MIAGTYARWCTQQMIEGVARHYNDREWHPVSRKNTHLFDT